MARACCSVRGLKIVGMVVVDASIAAVVRKVVVLFVVRRMRRRGRDMAWFYSFRLQLLVLVLLLLSFCVVTGAARRGEARAASESDTCVSEAVGRSGRPT